ncbi:MAG: hypothetical protein ABIV47_04260 [Roseiflexaceae bacterium]
MRRTRGCSSAVRAFQLPRARVRWCATQLQARCWPYVSQAGVEDAHAAVETGVISVNTSWSVHYGDAVWRRQAQRRRAQAWPIRIGALSEQKSVFISDE